MIPWLGSGLSRGLSFSCSSAGKESTCNAGDLGLIPRLGRSPGEGKGYPLQYSGLENSVDCIERVGRNWAIFTRGVREAATGLPRVRCHRWELTSLCELGTPHSTACVCVKWQTWAFRAKAELEGKDHIAGGVENAGKATLWPQGGFE